MMSKKKQVEAAKKRKEKLLGHSGKEGFTVKRGILIGGVVLFILGLAGGAIYYVNSIIPKDEEAFEEALINEGPKKENNKKLNAERRKHEAALLNSIEDDSEDDTPLSLTEVGVSEETGTLTATTTTPLAEKKKPQKTTPPPKQVTEESVTESSEEDKVKMTFYSELSSDKKEMKVVKPKEKGGGKLLSETVITTPPKKKAKKEKKSPSGTTTAKSKRPQKESPASPLPPRKQITNPKYRLQVASYRSQKDALAQAASLTKKGEDATTQQVNLGQKGIWFRVYVGKYANRASAKKDAKRLKQKYKINTLVVRYKK